MEIGDTAEAAQMKGDVVTVLKSQHHHSAPQAPQVRLGVCQGGKQGRHQLKVQPWKLVLSKEWAARR